MFDSLNRRTCLHYAAYYGHSDCLEAIIAAAHSASVAATWSVSRLSRTRSPVFDGLFTLKWMSLAGDLLDM